MSSSAGMMTFPTEWKSNIHVPNRQPDCCLMVTYQANGHETRVQVIGDDEAFDHWMDTISKIR